MAIAITPTMGYRIDRYNFKGGHKGEFQSFPKLFEFSNRTFRAKVTTTFVTFVQHFPTIVG